MSLENHEAMISIHTSEAIEFQSQHVVELTGLNADLHALFEVVIKSPLTVWAQLRYWDYKRKCYDVSREYRRAAPDSAYEEI